MVWKAGEHNAIMKSQSAAPGGLAVRAILNKVLGFEILRQTKMNGASGDADAVGCYARIIPPPSQLACRRWGLPRSAAKMITLVLNNTI